MFLMWSGVVVLWWGCGGGGGSGRRISLCIFGGRSPE